MKTYFPIRKTNKLSKQILIQPMFVDQRLKSPKKIKGLGENYSWSQNTILRSVEKDLKKGIQNFLLFIVPKEKQKLPEDFSFHYEVIRSLKNHFKKDLTLLIDTCLCSITPDGHCGISQNKKINLSQTHYALGLAANTYLEAGADIIAPSDMMKNTTQYLRKVFSENEFNYFKASKHAEQLAIEYCEKNKHRNYEIYIWKYDKHSSIKQANCCHSCTILANKYNYKIFTFDKDMNKISAIIDNPQISLCYKMKHNCFH